MRSGEIEVDVYLSRCHCRWRAKKVVARHLLEVFTSLRFCAKILQKYSIHNVAMTGAEFPRIEQ